MTDFEKIGKDIADLKAELEQGGEALEQRIAPDGGETTVPL